MVHVNTIKVVEEWSRRREPPDPPRRADIMPAAFGPLLPQLFMLGQTQDGQERFRLAGGLLTDLHGRSLKGEPFTALWGRDAPRVLALVDQARNAAEPVALRAAAFTAEGDETRLEVLLAPLIGPDDRVDRTLGLYQPTSSLARLLGRPIETLVLLSSGFVRLPGRRSLRLVAIDGRRVA